MKALRRRHGRSSAHDLSYGEHYVHDHGDVLGMAIGVGAGALVGGGLGGAGAVAGATLGAVAGAAAALAIRRRKAVEA